MDRIDNTIATIAVDQAASLRRLVGGGGGRAIAIIGAPSAGVTTIAVNLAASLAALDRRTLLIDEDDTTHSAVNRLQLRQRHRFEHVVGRDIRLDELLLDSTGFQLLPLSMTTASVTALPPGRIDQLADEYDSLTARIDWVLIDARPPSGDRPPGLALAADETILVLSPSADAITESYAAMKRLHADFGRKEFRVLANRVRTLDTAMALFNRIKSVAAQHMQVRMRLMGFVPEDEALYRADRLGQPVGTAFPGAESSIAFAQLANAMLAWRRRTTPADRANLLYRALDMSRRLRHG